MSFFSFLKVFAVNQKALKQLALDAAKPAIILAADREIDSLVAHNKDFFVSLFVVQFQSKLDSILSGNPLLAPFKQQIDSAIVRSVGNQGDKSIGSVTQQIKDAVASAVNSVKV